MLSKRNFACRANFKLGNLTPGETADLWLDIKVPKKSGSEKKGRERKRDKVLGLFMGAKGNQEKDVEDCRVHIQARLHPPCFCTPLLHAPYRPVQGLMRLYFVIQKIETARRAAFCQR